MTPDEYRAQDGVGLAQLIAQGQISATEVAEAAISLIEALNPRLNAVVLDRFDAARAEAERLRPRGPLAGATFLLKDVNLFGADMPTRFASRFFAGAEPKPDSTMVRRWREAGLVILGRTNTPEFAGDFITEPQLYGPTLNPWNEGVTVGGSSGGAAAAVASGMVPLAHGTDLGGSIRIPAACCGVFGFKPSVGLNPLGPPWEEIAGGLDADHVLTRSVRDSAASLDVTAGPDTGTRLNRLPPSGGFLAGLVAPLPRLRIGVALEDPAGRRAGANQAAAVERTARLLSGLSHHLEPYAFPPEALPGPWFDALWTTDILHLVQERGAELGRDPSEDELDDLTRAALRHARTLSAVDYLDARLAMARAAQAIGRSRESFDIVLTPSLAEDPPSLGELDFATNGRDLDRWNARGYAFAPFSTPANLAGQPSASCPVMIGGSGLPLAVQITGKPGADLLVLQLARELEDATEWQRTFQGLWKRLA
ncbi:amidase [Rubellimicrobium rubrum]|uniref:Amidase n=1 Tax=Rubellimicrobium rubrum TaxID=2585369 RepID=A0A5C4N2L9_9RHOB|nr:amidase [Rubellimicrobium rubrum]TNC52499.1 amidase [Rubellimicrobium rubrum]